MDSSNKPIGVFDSGLGGISVLKELISIMPNENYIYYGDSYYAPYGTKKKEEVIDRCTSISEFLLKQDVKAIVIACNTATSAAVKTLRDKYTKLPIIGMEPALKVAAQNKSNKNIIVMATPLALCEEKFKCLVENYGKSNNVIKLPCPELVEIVENDKLNDEELVINQLNNYFTNIALNEIDSIVLGCTHFVFYRRYLEKIVAPETRIIDGNNGTVRHLQVVLDENKILNCSNSRGTINFFNTMELKGSKENEKYIELSKRLLNYL